MRNVSFARLTIAVMAAGAFAAPLPAQSGTITPAPEPLGTATTTIQPNVMFILDDSGSMAWDYMPNYVIDSDNPTNSTASCYDVGDDGDGSGTGTIDGRPNACQFGDPPYNSTDLNNIYYNPGIWYRPATTYDPNTEMPSQNAANTSNYTQVLRDAFIGGGATDDLVSGYPDRVWCISQSDTANGGNCRQNSSYRYPDFQFPYGDTTGGNTKYTFGSPYYYRMQTAQWCDSAARTNCKSGSAATAGTYTFIAPEFCTDKELTNCAAGSGVTSAHIYSGVRWCSDSGTLLKCQRKKIGAFVYPKHVGVVVSQTGTFPAVSNEGAIQVTGVNAAGGSISSIQIGGVTVTGGPITITSGTGNTTAASQIASAINAFTSSPDYSAVASGALVTITNTTPGAAGSGLTVVVNADQIGTASARGRVTVGSSSAPSTGGTVASITVGGTSLFCSLASTPSAPSTIGSVTVNSNGSLSHTGLNTNTKRSDLRNAINDRVTRCASVLGNGFTTSTGNSGSGSSVSYYVNLIAPLSAGASYNTQVVTAGSGSSNIANVTYANMSGGTSTSFITTAVSPMTGGQDAFTGTRKVRIGRGLTTRTDIVPSNNSYPKVGARLDCAGSTCTYDEEMTNFANWYAYYRTRLQMAKTSVGRAFLPLDPTFRVGFITINPGSPVDTTNKYLKIDFFTAGAGGHKQAWYDVLYNSDTINSTPLREALSRVGWIYAGQLNTGLTNGIPTADDPMIVSCQPNFAILSTDGYWNGNGGQKLSGVAMDTQDSNILQTPRPMYDGGTQSTVIETNDYTFFTAPINTNGCTSGRARNMVTTITTTRTIQYDATGNVTSDNTITATDTSNYSSCSLTPPAPPANYSTNTTTNSNTAAGSGSVGSLADVAMYYYLTDLRTSGPYSTNNVPITDKDKASYQHMVTFTIGLGLDGQLSYQDDYETATSGDFFNIKQGPNNWPAPASNSPSALDDLWHAAVNGHGVFFSAKNPQELSNGLTETLNQLTVRVGAGAAAATSNLQPVAGDNFAFTAQYQTGDWVGDLKARTIDLQSGVVSFIQLWSAASLLDSTAYTSRKIFTFDPTDTTGNLLKHFCMPSEGGTNCSDGSGLDATEQGYFDPTLLANYGSMTAGQKATITAQKLVNWVRGDTGYENSGATLDTDLFRNRLSLLGDIVNAQPAYVKKSPFSYGDTGYGGFRACTEGTGTACNSTQFPTPTVARRGTVFAAANDGMLHAFETDVNNNPYFQLTGISTAATADDTFTGNNAGNGVERWAYIPRMIMSKLPKLAEQPYAHQYTVDGSPQVGDICVSTPCGGQDDWRTILVAGLNSGGRGYYALDVTNPLAPKALWEFTNAGVCYTDAQIAVGDKTSDCNLGLTYGNPIITKLGDGTWVVIVTSGYNNNISGGDGRGYLYILEAATGKILQRLTTGVGTAASPSGLGRINGWAINSNVDNTAISIYGGDLEGNLWRFQLDPNAGSPAGSQYLSVTRVAVAKDSSGNTQPITVKPELGEYGGKRIILFGTGLFLQNVDKTPPFTTQTIYALRDDPTQYPTTGDVVPNVRDGTDVRVRTLATGTVTDTRTVTAGTAPNWSTEHGWLIDLPESGERVNVDPQLQLGTLVVASNVPSGDTCTAGGFSFVNFLDYATGSYIPGAANGTASVKIASSLTVGINVIMLPGGAVKTIITTADNQQLSTDTPVPPNNFTGQRVSWRELLIDK